MGFSHKVIAGVSAVCLAGSGLLVGAGAATAASGGFKEVSAPKSVVSGQMFTVKCQVGKSWTGWKAIIQEKGAAVNASRTIGRGGDCTMRLVLGPTGKKQIRVRVIGGNNALNSSWMKVSVKPA